MFFSMNNLISFFLYFLVVTFLISCRKDEDKPQNLPQNPPKVAFINACSDCPKLGLTVDSMTSEFANFSYNSNIYLNVKSGKRIVQITDTTKESTIFNFYATFSPDKSYTLAITGKKANATSNLIQIEDILPSTVDTNKAYIRFINLTSDGGNISFNIEGQTDMIVHSLAPTFSSEFIALTPDVKLEYKLENSSKTYKVNPGNFSKNSATTIYVTGLVGETSGTKVITNGIFKNK